MQVNFMVPVPGSSRKKRNKVCRWGKNIPYQFFCCKKNIRPGVNKKQKHWNMSLREQWSMMCLRSVFFHLLICFNTVQRENYDNGNHQVKEGVGPI